MAVVILVPHRDENDYRQWRDWFKDRLAKPPGTSFLEMRGLALTTLRQSLAESALADPNNEWLMWLDDDVIGEEDSLHKLLSHRLPICTGWYWTKKKKGERGLSAWQAVNKPLYNGPWQRNQAKGYEAISIEQDARLVQCDVAGMGICLTHRSVFDGLSKPWFEWPVEGPSEDFYFFEKVAREKGIKPIVDMEVKSSHVGSFMIEPSGEFDLVRS
jgi:hypothetical protein